MTELHCTIAMWFKRLVKPLLKLYRRLNAERKAVAKESTDSVDLLRKPLLKTLRRFQGGRVGDAWWRRALNWTSQQFVARNLQMTAAHKTWLRNQKVEDDLLELAKAFILRVKANNEYDIRKRLSDSFTNITGEAKESAESFINKVVAAMAEGCLASIPREQQLTVAITQESNRLQRVANMNVAELNHDSGCAPYLQITHTRRAETVLATILSYRMLDRNTARKQILVLFQLVEEGGELEGTIESVRNRVRYWTARLCAQNPDTLETAKSIRSNLNQDHCEECLVVVDAFIASTMGDKDRAMLLVSDIDEPDARTVFFSLLCEHDGETAALTWCKGISPDTHHSYFTHAGWKNWAIATARVGHWIQAAQGLRVIERHLGREPSVSLVEGTINAALILPQEHQDEVFNNVPLYPSVAPNIDPIAETHRERALECFDYVLANIGQVTDKECQTTVEDWILWLRLMNPNKKAAQRVQHEVICQMTNGIAAVQLVPFAWAFGFDLKDEPLRSHLRQKRRLGDLSDREIVAECLLNERTLGAREFAYYLEEYAPQLNQVIHPKATTSMVIEALVKDGQIDKAQKLVAEYKERLDSATINRINTLLALINEESADHRSELEERYEESGSLVDLRNLILYLKKVEDYTALVQRLREIFELERSSQNALELVSVLSRHAKDHQSVLSFFDEYPTLNSEDRELRSTQAWALFHTGNFEESRKINDMLLATRKNLNDLYLDINLGVATGDWDRLPAIVEREWQHRKSLEPAVLLKLAQIAAQHEQSHGRAIELARLAACKSSNDPTILVTVYGIHFELGFDDQADSRWLENAVNLSSENGPVWRSDIKELVEQCLPAMKDQSDRISRMLLTGKIPMHLAVSKLNLPLSRILLADKWYRSDHRDGRVHPVFPTASPVRSVVTMQKTWSVGLDVSSILVLWRIELLQIVINTLNHVNISSDTMQSLFFERSSVRFHQPSRVRQARRIRHLLDREQLKVVPDIVIVNGETAKEFGVEKAELLEICKKNQGVVVCVRPLYKADSLDLEVADVSKYDGMLCSPADLCSLAYRKGGVIDSDTYERAKRFFASLNMVPDTELLHSCLDGPVYVDTTALSHLYSAQVLQELVVGGLELYVHTSVKDEVNVLLETGEAATDLTKEIEQLATVLRSGIERDVISVLPKSTQADDNEFSRRTLVSSLNELIASAGKCDAICVDDRYINKSSASTGLNGTDVPIVCVLDILQHLRAQNVLDDLECWKKKHKLRETGFTFVPVDVNELIHWLEATEVIDGHMIENSELKTIRQILNSEELIKMSSEQELQALDIQLQLVSAQVISKLWSDTSLDTDTVAVLCTWIWRYILATTYLPGHSELDDLDDSSQPLVTARIRAMLLISTFLDSKERREAYQKWVEPIVVARLKPANTMLFEEAVVSACEAIEQIGQYRKIMVLRLLELVPDNVLDTLVRKNQKFAEECGISFREVVRIGNSVQLVTTDLIRAARRVFKRNLSQQVASLSGKTVIVERVDNGETLQVSWIDKKQVTQRIEVPELTLVCPDPEIRTARFTTVIEQFGPTATLPSGLRKEVISRTLTDEEMATVFREKVVGVAAEHDKLAAKISLGLLRNVHDIVPNSLEYWERFCGPHPEGRDAESWYRDVLVPYRKELLETNLQRGLDICCLGAIHDDFAPGAWLVGLDDEAVWEALQSIKLYGNPIALLSAVDVALYRSHDERFLNLSIELLSLLLNDPANITPKNDSFTLLQMFCDLIVNRLPLVQGASRYPSFWRRMCAWMQAGCVVRQFVASNIPIVVKEIEHWCKQNVVRVGELRRYVDLREEPLVFASSVGARNLRHEVLTRLRTLKQRHEQAGRKVPRAREIESVTGNLLDVDEKELFIVPGPGELHIRAEQAMPQDISSSISDCWRKEEATQAMGLVAWTSQCFYVGDENLDRTKSALRELAEKIEETKTEEAMSKLNSSSIVAAATGNKLIADEVGFSITTLAKSIDKPKEVIWIINLLLQTAGAFSEIEEWRGWLDRKFVAIARVLPATPKECLQELVRQMEALEVVVPIECWFHLRAKSIAVSGIVTAT